MAGIGTVLVGRQEGGRLGDLFGLVQTVQVEQAQDRATGVFRGGF